MDVDKFNTLIRKYKLDGKFKICKSLSEAHMVLFYDKEDIYNSNFIKILDYLNIVFIPDNFIVCFIQLLIILQRF